MPKPSDLAERVYRDVRSMILRYELKPGQRIDLLQTASRLGVSLTPLREALRRLVQEEYVSHIPNRGFLVKEITIEEAECLYDVREALEAHAIEAATARMTPERLGEIARLAEMYHQSVLQSIDRNRFLVDKLFHIRIAEASGNFVLVRMLEQVLDRIIMKNRLEGMPSDRGHIAYQEHLQVIDAFKAQDAPQAVASIRRHIANAKEGTLFFLRSRLTPPDSSFMEEDK